MARTITNVEKQFHDRIVASLGDGKTHIEVAIANGLLEDTAKRVLYSLGRYHARVHIARWVELSDGRQLGVYVEGLGNNARRPYTRNTLTPNIDLEAKVLASLPADRMCLADILGIGVNRVTLLTKKLIKDGKIETTYAEKGTKRVLYCLAGQTDPNAIVPKSGVRTRTQTQPLLDDQGSRVRIGGSRFLTFPWPGYNKHPEGTKYPSTWRHVDVPVVKEQGL